MLSKYSNLIDKILTGKAIIVIIMLGTTAFFVYKNLDFITEITFKVDRPVDKKNVNKQSKTTGIPHLELISVQVPPVQTKLQSSLSIEIQNTGSSSAENVEVLVDLSKSLASEYEIVSPNNYKIISEPTNTNIIKFTVEKLNQHESIYLYALLSSPFYNKIVINADNINSAIVHNYKDNIKSESSGFVTLFKIIAGVFIVVISVMLLFWMCTFLNKVLKLE